MEGVKSKTENGNQYNDSDQEENFKCLNCNMEFLPNKPVSYVIHERACKGGMSFEVEDPEVLGDTHTDVGQVEPSKDLLIAQNISNDMTDKILQQNMIVDKTNAENVFHVEENFSSPFNCYICDKELDRLGGSVYLHYSTFHFSEQLFADFSNRVMDDKCLDCGSRLESHQTPHRFLVHMGVKHKRVEKYLPNWIKLGLVKKKVSPKGKKKVSVSDGGDERVKRRTRSFYLEHAEENENMKKNETQARDKDKLAVGNERLKKNKTIRNKDEHAMWNEKLEKNETPARDKGSNVSTKDIKTAKNEMPVRARNDYNLPPPDENTCHISNDREDCCKTMCKICEQPCALTKMRFHTIKEHNLQVWKGVSDTQ